MSQILKAQQIKSPLISTKTIIQYTDKKSENV